MSSVARFLFMSVLLFGSYIRPGLAALSESQIKTAYVLNFVKFTEWPAATGAAGKVKLCVVGNNVLGGALSALQGMHAGNRVLQVAHFATANDKLESCQVVFIGNSEQQHFLSIIKSLGGAPALTISDIDDFAEKGGCIGLRYREDRIVFEINLESLRKSGLHLPGQLLNLAYYVFGRR